VTEVAVHPSQVIDDVATASSFTVADAVSWSRRLCSFALVFGSTGAATAVAAR
jgi:hypothetical protein